MTLFTSTDRPRGREYHDVFLLSGLATPLMAEARVCGDIPSGLWLFLARLGEGVPASRAELEYRLWTTVADVNFNARLSGILRPAQSDPVKPRLHSSRVHDNNADALEAIAATTGLAGIAICLDREHVRNDGLIQALTCMLEPRLPDDTGPVVWYGKPLEPLDVEVQS